MAATAAPIIMVSSGSVGTSSQLSGISQPSVQANAAANLQALANQQFQPYYLRPAYRFKTNNQPIIDASIADGPGRRLRRNVANVRRHIDYIANVLRHCEARLWQYGTRDRIAIQPDILYQNYVLPPSSTLDKPVDCVLTKFVRAAMNKVKCPIYSICWTPEGKRLITGASTGEFTLWNGTAFNFETILQAHDTAIRALKWSHNDQWLVSADHDGFVKYWQPNMNNVHMYQAHKDEPIRSISFAPTDIKLVTGSDDGTARIWDFGRCAEERVLRGHGSDVRCVDWHPQKGLICTGSRDSQQPVKLWDPNTGQCLSTLHDHKNSVMSVQWNKNGNWLITGSKDHLIKLYDIRMMREMRSYRGHKKEVTALAWHPVHESLFVSGGGDGSLAYWLVNAEKELGFLEHAHDQAVWTLEWHPLGHILASGSNDNNTKFWARNRPGDTHDDIFGMTPLTGAPLTILNSEMKTNIDDISNVPVIPGMGLDDDIFQGLQNRETVTVVGGPKAGVGSVSGPLLFPEDPNARQQSANIGAKRTLIKQPPPKKAQRQFERMWNVAKPAGGGEDFEEEMPEESSFRRPKASLLGPPPTSMLAAAKQQEQHRSPSPQRSINLHGNGTIGDQRRQGNHLQSVDAKNPVISSQLSSTTLAQNNSQNILHSTQQWSTGPMGPTATVQQISLQENNVFNPSVIAQQDIPTLLPQTTQIIAGQLPLAFQQQSITGPLIWPPTIVQSNQQQNLDIDYRMAQSTLNATQTVPTATQQGIISGDIDLRHGLTTSGQSQSWRPTPSTSVMESTQCDDDMLRPSDEPRIHDPRIRRNRDGDQQRMAIRMTRSELDGFPEIEATKQDIQRGRGNENAPMRDPRRRPPLQPPPHSQDLDDYERSDVPKPLRCWMPNDDGSNFMGPNKGMAGEGIRGPPGYNNNDYDYEEYDDWSSSRQQPSFHPYGRGNHFRRGHERGRGWGRSRRPGY